MGPLGGHGWGLGRHHGGLGRQWTGLPVRCRLGRGLRDGGAQAIEGGLDIRGNRDVVDDADGSPVHGLDETVLRGHRGAAAARPPGIEVACGLACLKYPPPSPDTLSSPIIPPDPTLKLLLTGSSTVRAAEHDSACVHAAHEGDTLILAMDSLSDNLVTRAATNMLAVGILSKVLCSGDTPSGRRVMEEGRKWKGGKNGDIGVVVDVRSLDDLNLAVSAAVSASAEGHPWKSGTNSMEVLSFPLRAERVYWRAGSDMMCMERMRRNLWENEGREVYGQTYITHYDSNETRSTITAEDIEIYSAQSYDDHPEYTICVYDPKYHFLGALHYNSHVPNHAQFLPNNPNHQATCVIRLVTEKKVPDSQVYFDFSIQRSLPTICRLADNLKLTPKTSVWDYPISVPDWHLQSQIPEMPVSLVWASQKMMRK
ncbi:hypothetical protein IW261DRAFT_1428266 [Armillaria novae-zelandiae]|uniref:Uncharacterized protein n=1 Tax=Armillaria novae-zelandiae TaxID=153914 RepID=A0AA39NAL5_9AGAR|nr:hypothetical protein IW261DRAFT_1428266 [Armillaria novae-zelandiae]